MEKKYKHFGELVEAKGIIHKQSHQTLSPANALYYPLQMTSQGYLDIMSKTRVWQKLVLKASEDSSLILKVFEPLKKSDDWINFLMNIYTQIYLFKENPKISLTFSRIDYMLDSQMKPKITEYNLISVGGSHYNDLLYEIKKIEDLGNKNKYFKSQSVLKFVQQIKNIYDQQNLSGIVVFLINTFELNQIEQKNIEIKLLEQGIRSKRLLLEDILKKSNLDQKNDLYYEEDLVSIIYYRTGYNMNNFEAFTNEEAVLIKQKLVKSNAISIPNIAMELVNLKRMQVELSKPNIMRQYLSQQQARIIQQTLVDIWDFDEMTDEEFNSLKNLIEKNPENYILKPNRQAGDNNYYQIDALNKLKTLDREQRKTFILMKQIQTASFQNVCILRGGLEIEKNNYAYEVGIFGVFGLKNGLFYQQNVGHMVRSRAKGQNEGHIYAGRDGYVSWRGQAG